MAASATMSDLPNELLLDISRRIPKASERLHLTLANHRMSRLTGSILYEHIIISKAAYGLKCRKLGDNPSFATYTAIRSLARTLRRNKHHFGSAIHTLEISLEHRYPLETHIQHKQNMKSFGLALLTLQFDMLQHLHLAMTGHIKHICRRSERFSPCALLPPLLCISDTLESLVLSADGYYDGSSLGSLRNFTSLKALCIQGDVLTGESSLNPSKGPKISEVLPSSLQELEIHCCSEGSKFEEIRFCSKESKLEEEALTLHAEDGVFVTCPLDKFALNAPEKPRRLQSLMVCLLDYDFSIAGEMPIPAFQHSRPDLTSPVRRLGMGNMSLAAIPGSTATCLCSLLSRVLFWHAPALCDDDDNDDDGGGLSVGGWSWKQRPKAR